MTQGNIIFCRKCGSILPRDLRNGSIECIFCHAVYAVKFIGKPPEKEIVCPFCQVKNPPWVLSCENCQTALQNIELVSGGQVQGEKSAASLTAQESETRSPTGTRNNEQTKQGKAEKQKQTPNLSDKDQYFSTRHSIDQMASSKAQQAFLAKISPSAFDGKIEAQYQDYRREAIRINQIKNAQFLLLSAIPFFVVCFALFMLASSLQPAFHIFIYVCGPGLCILILLAISGLIQEQKMEDAKRAAKTRPGFDQFFIPSIQKTLRLWPEKGLTPKTYLEFIKIVNRTHFTNRPGYEKRHPNTAPEKMRTAHENKTKAVRLENIPKGKIICPRCGSVFPDARRYALIQCAVCGAGYQLSGEVIKSNGTFICTKCFRSNSISSKACAYCGHAMYGEVYKKFASVLMQHAARNQSRW